MSCAAAPGAFPAISISSAANGPISHQIFRQLKDLIRTGRLRNGARLPSTGQLAADLGVSRNMAVSAYEELRAESYIVSLVGAGSSVAAPQRRRLAMSTSRPLVSERMREVLRSSTSAEPGLRIGEPFEVDLPAIDFFPRKVWARIAANRYARSLPHLLSHSETGGYLPLRRQIAEHVRETRGIECEPDQVIIMGGQGQAIGHCAALLVEPGDVGSWKTRRVSVSASSFVQRGPISSRYRWTTQFTTSTPRARLHRMPASRWSRHPPTFRSASACGRKHARADRLGHGGRGPLDSRG